ncbi:protein KINESIN LIGHT CHAIN-RELATED [Trifolium repens]|nr:protein KINESIN LIGHT CHAIN-RELATED [Trifolium repens]
MTDLHRQRSSLQRSSPLPETQLQSNSQSLLLDSQLQSQLPHSKRNSSIRFQNRISIHNCNCSSFIQHRNSSIHNRISSVRKHVPELTAREIASGLTKISAIYEVLSKPEEALKLLQKAVKLLEGIPGQYRTIAGIKARMGQLQLPPGVERMERL